MLTLRPVWLYWLILALQVFCQYLLLLVIAADIARLGCHCLCSRLLCSVHRLLSRNAGDCKALSKRGGNPESSFCPRATDDALWSADVARLPR